MIAVSAFRQLLAVGGILRKAHAVCPLSSARPDGGALCGGSSPRTTHDTASARTDDGHPHMGIRRTPDLEARARLEVPHNGETPAVDVERPAGELPWGRQTGRAEALWHTAAPRARAPQVLTPGRLGMDGG